jgi:ribosomal protein S18 acetylase RimI-like enzyme
LVIRQVTSSDTDSLLSFWAQAGENHSRPLDSAQLIEALLLRDAESLFIADLNGRIVGTVIAGWDGWRAHLYRLAVAPDLRGRGIARQLLSRAEERLRTFGAVRFEAMVWSDNDTGSATWFALGYQPQGDWVRWIKPS